LDAAATADACVEYPSGVWNGCASAYPNTPTTRAFCETSIEDVLTPFVFLAYRPLWDSTVEVTPRNAATWPEAAEASPRPQEYEPGSAPDATRKTSACASAAPRGPSQKSRRTSVQPEGVEIEDAESTRAVTDATSRSPARRPEGRERLSDEALSADALDAATKY
jgi:hypothetical protein